MTMSQPDLKPNTEANRAAWNEVMPKQQMAGKGTLNRLFSQPGYVHSSAVEIGML
jgi:hypothetical protein